MKIKMLLALSAFSCSALAVHAAATAAPAAASSTAKPASPAVSAAGPYHLIKEIHIGGSPRTDYLTVDSENRRLYVSHLDSVAVIDLDKNEVVGNITGNLGGIHGIAIANKLGLGFISNGATTLNNVAIFDLKTLKVTKTVATGGNPDWIMFEPGQKEVYAFNGRSNSATVFDPVSGNIIETITLPGKPESATFDVAGRVYDNIEDKSEVVAIDTKTHKIVATWPNPPYQASGQAIDLAHHLLFLGCDDTMVMMDIATGKVVSTLKATTGIDSAAFDPGTGYAFVPAGGPAGSSPGSLTIGKVVDGKLTLVQQLSTPHGAKTIALDPSTHNIYTATVKYDTAAPAPAAASASGTARGGRGPAPTPVADSFEVLVYGMDAPPASSTK